MAEPVKPTIRTEVSAIPVNVAPDFIPPFKEQFPVNEILVDGLANAALIGGLLRLALFVERPDPTDGGIPARPIVCRLAMTPMAAALLKQTVASMLDNMVAAGIISELPTVVEQT